MLYNDVTILFFGVSFGGRYKLPKTVTIYEIRVVEIDLQIHSSLTNEVSNKDKSNRPISFESYCVGQNWEFEFLIETNLEGNFLNTRKDMIMREDTDSSECIFNT